MKKLLLCFVGFITIFSYSQNKTLNFTILKIGTKYSKELITTAINKADMCGSFYESKPNDIVFDDGSIVRLFSKKEIGSNSSMSSDCFVADTFKFEEIAWSILPNGYIAKGYTARPNKSYLKK
jgi:hypothetical protein